MPRRPRALFLGSGYAGHRTRFLNLQQHAQHDPRLDSTWRMVTGWREGGRIEGLPGLPRGVRGRLRASAETLALLRVPRPDVIWTSVSADLAPLAWSVAGPFRRPVVMDLDWTLDQREELAPWYYDRPARSGLVSVVNRAREQAIWDRVSLFTPWSQWAADALRARGIEERRIRVLAPGVDTDYWRPAEHRAPRGEDAKLRLLFVGGDFRRKGGDLLLSVLSGPLGERCHLDIVTREDVASTPGVTVHRAEPNSAALLQLYQQADLFVLPSLAECFGIATIEAMATGLPVLVSDRGASREIVTDGRTGWLMEPTAQALHDRLLYAADQRVALPAMGRAGRADALSRFDGVHNDAAVADIVVSLTTAQRPAPQPLRRPL